LSKAQNEAHGEMRVSGGPRRPAERFAYALAEIEATDPAIEDVDLTSSLAQGYRRLDDHQPREPEPAVAKLTPRYGPPFPEWRPRGRVAVPDRDGRFSGTLRRIAPG
jgi:hypothetical protein